MADRTLTLAAGVVLFAAATLVLLSSLLPDVGFPVVTYVLVGIGLFAGVYLIGMSHPEQVI